MKKKIIALVLAVSTLVAAVALGGTLAYLTDTSSSVNVATMGNVKVEQHEYQRAEGVKHTGTLKEGDLVPFEQGQPLYPAYAKDSTAYTAEPTDLLYWGEYVTAERAGNGLWNDEKLFGAMDKFVFVENTGKSDAYYRTWIALECPKGMEFSEGSDKEFMMNVNLNALFKWDEIGYVEISGQQYLVMCATYTEVLKPGEISRPSLLQVVMTHNVENADVAKIGDTYEILTFTQAVQVDNMPEAKLALDAAFGSDLPWNDVIIADEIGITEAGEYNLDKDVYTIDSAYFHTQKVSGDAVVINGNGSTVEGIVTSVDAFQWEGGTIPAMSPIFSSADGSKVTVNDLKFTGTMSAIMLGHYQNANYNNYNTEFNNVDVIDTKVVSFSANVSPAVCVYGTAVLNNCNIYGTTLSELDTDPMWPVYDLVAVNYTDLTINDSDIGSLLMWNQAKVTVADGTEVDELVVLGNMNTTKYGLVIKAGAEVGVIDLSRLTNKDRTNITIEDGATVGGFLGADGVTYATLADWKAGATMIETQDQLNALEITNGKVIRLADGEFYMPAGAKGKTFTVYGSGNTVINVVPAGQGEAGGQLDYNLDGSNVTFNNVTIKTNSQLYAGYARLSATYNNCVIQNTYNLGTGNSVFNNCVFNITNEYLRVAGATSAEFNGCTFNTEGRAILVYQDGTHVDQTVTVKDCTFKASAAAKTWNGIHVAAVSIDGTSGKYVVNLEGDNVVGANFNGLWQIKAGEANVTVNE